MSRSKLIMNLLYPGCEMKIAGWRTGLYKQQVLIIFKGVFRMNQGSLPQITSSI
jgi:hypothetical protein